MKKDKKQIMTAILDQPPAMPKDAMYGRLVQLADLSKRQLAERIRSVDYQTSTEALFVLAAMNGRRASRCLLDIVLDKGVSARTRQMVASDLTLLVTPNTRRQICNLLEDTHADVDCYTKTFLVELASNFLSNRVAKIIVKLLEDWNEDPLVRAQAAYVIVDTFDEYRYVQVEQALVEQLKNPAALVRMSCCRALSASTSTATIAALKQVLDDQTVVHSDILTTLCGKVGTGAEVAIEAITATINQRNRNKLNGRAISEFAPNSSTAPYLN